MNILGWAVIVMVVATFLVLVSLIFNNERYGRIAHIIALLCMVVAIYAIVLDERYRKESSTVPKLNQATNGLYEVLVTYQNVDGGTLVILHPASITHIDVTERGVSSVRFGSPQLLAIDHPIFGTQPTNSGTFKEFVEIIGEGKNKVIQTFRPFPSVQQ